MRAAMPGVLVVGLMVAASAAAVAQQGPMVVPIVGSPAAEQQQQQQQPRPPLGPIPEGPVSTAPGVLTPPIIQGPVGASAMPPIMQTPAGQAAMPPILQSPVGQPAGDAAAAASARKLQLSFNQGHVNLVAQNVTVREILNEWQRQNGCQFVNSEKLTGGPVSFEFGQETELHVIEALLRGAAGYIIAPRADSAQSGSVCGSVFILPTSRPTSTASTYTPNMFSPLAAPLMQPGSPDDEIPPVMPQMGPQTIQSRQGQMPPTGQQPGQPAPTAFGPVPVVTTPGVGRIGGAPPAGPPISPLPGNSPIPNGPGRGGGQ
jgi:hypothetical protein